MESGSFWEVDFTSDVCVILGNEEKGSRPATLSLCDEVAGIPMANEVDSLNVSNAAGVFCTEVNSGNVPGRGDDFAALCQGP